MRRYLDGVQQLKCATSTRWIVGIFWTSYPPVVVSLFTELCCYLLHRITFR